MHKTSLPCLGDCTTIHVQSASGSALMRVQALLCGQWTSLTVFLHAQNPPDLSSHCFSRDVTPIMLGLEFQHMQAVLRALGLLYVMPNCLALRESLSVA